MNKKLPASSWLLTQAVGALCGVPLLESYDGRTQEDADSLEAVSVDVSQDVDSGEEGMGMEECGMGQGGSGGGGYGL